MLSDETIIDYVDNGGSHCPYCQFPQIIDTGPLELRDNEGYQNQKCLACGREWTDEYKLELNWITEEPDA